MPSSQRWPSSSTCEADPSSHAPYCFESVPFAITNRLHIWCSADRLCCVRPSFQEGGTSGRLRVGRVLDLRRAQERSKSGFPQDMHRGAHQGQPGRADGFHPDGRCGVSDPRNLAGKRPPPHGCSVGFCGQGCVPWPRPPRPRTPYVIRILWNGTGAYELEPCWQRLIRPTTSSHRLIV